MTKYLLEFEKNLIFLIKDGYLEIWLYYRSKSGDFAHYAASSLIICRTKEE